MFTFQLRRGTIQEWTSLNPILDEGEPGVEYETGYFKIGNGSTNWLDLPYFLTEDGVLSLFGGSGSRTSPDDISKMVSFAQPN